MNALICLSAVIIIAIIGLLIACACILASQCDHLDDSGWDEDKNL